MTVPEEYALSHERLDYFFERPRRSVRDFVFGEYSATPDDPVLVLLGGQPGAGKSRAVESVKERHPDRLVPILTPRQPKTDSTDVLVMSPAEHLTHRYLATDLPPRLMRGAEAAWHHRLQALPARELLDRALADPDLDAADHLAVVGLLAQLRAEWEATEATALQRAHEAGASWADIGAALGITRQSAHARARRRSTGTPTRLSGQH
ncbi:zeta toxin family protein (plasmid) [Thermobifida halotolerans]|uniref:UDP-N-acetylglucosamine kinase n=1 Tax=Thermobifida halotolerans TaxID=483545 RepID=A0AA97M2E6_9ACTN|nr:zeta toxin family protein [Thermobifida halotolerans]UOE22269.1 zeta toxin family protein [Thermobifida halotolerans]